MTLQDAIRKLIEFYEYSLDQEWIINKLSWSVFQVWKEVNKK